MYNKEKSFMWIFYIICIVIPLLYTDTDTDTYLYI